MERVKQKGQNKKREREEVRQRGQGRKTWSGNKERIKY